MSTLAFLQNLSMWQMLLFLVVALLLFGRRLPEVGKSLGKGIVEFKKGLKGIEDEVEAQSSAGKRDDRRQEDPPYRPPLNAGGHDARVSRAESIDPATNPAPPPTATPPAPSPTSSSAHDQ